MYKNSREKTAKQPLSSQKTTNLPPAYKTTQSVFPTIKSTNPIKANQPNVPKRITST